MADPNSQTQSTLSAQLLFRFLFLSLPVLLVGGFGVSYYAQNLLISQATKNLASIASDRASRIETFARGTLDRVKFLAAQPYMESLISSGKPLPETAPLLEFLRGRNIYLFSAKGQLLYSKDTDDPPTKELLETVNRTRTLMSAEISDYRLDPRTHSPALYVAAPIFESSGAISGVVAARLLNEDIDNVVNDYVGLGKTGETVIGQIDGDETVVVIPLRSNKDAAFRVRFPVDQAPAALKAAVAGTRVQMVAQDYRGQKVVAVSHYLPSLGWGLVVKIDADEIFAPAVELNHGMIIGGFILLILFSIGAQAAARSLNTPLNQLTEATRRVEAGDLGARSGLENRPDELGYLGLAFDRMVARVQEATASLEQKVAERTQDLRAKTIEAERASHAKSEFLANMSHELRTPLNGILGYAQILSRLPNLPEKVASGFKVIQQSGQHLLTLINDILDLSKIEADRVDILPNDLYFREFLQGPIEIFKVRADAKDIEFVVDLAADLPLMVRADEKRLRQVLINLIGNALKFTDRGRVIFKVERREGKIRFSVQDTGIGIPASKMDQLFQAFSQVSDAERNAEGTGLGLALSQRLVKLMGGTIQVESEYGVGSTFWFELDIASSAVVLDRKRGDSETDGIIGYAGPRKKILIADDIALNRQVLVEMLEPLGFIIVQAVDGRQALEILQRERPDLVLTDIFMPIIDGVQFIQNARQMTGFDVLPIIPVSASVAELEMSRCHALDCHDFLAKPVEYPKLMECLKRRLNLQWIVNPETTPEKSDVPENFEPSPPLPIVEAKILSNLAKQGNLKALSAAVDKLVTEQPKYASFSLRMRQLIQEFRMKPIRQLIDEHQPENATEEP